MEILHIVIRNDLAKKFREEIYKRKGDMKEGNATEALEEALELWIDNDARAHLYPSSTTTPSSRPNYRRNAPLS